jgi:GTP-binding protein
VQALEDADGVILVVDALTGQLPADGEAADLVRRSGKPTVIAVNKADNPGRELGAPEFYALGAGEPYAISAYHGNGVSDLMNGLIDVMVNKPDFVREGRSIRIAIVGRPNVGKSAILNAVTGEERSIVSPIPGTTRDSIDSRFEYDGREITFLDTAGLRRRGKAEQGIEKYSALRSIAAIERAHLCLVVLSAEEFVTQQDAHIAGYVDDAARARVVVVNKWDLAPRGKAARADAERVVRGNLKFLPDVPVLFTSTLTGEGIGKILPALMEVHGEFTKRVPKSELSRCIFQALGDNSLPYSGRLHPRIFKVSQERTAPPTFVFNARHAELIHFSYRRYLENRLRAEFGFKGSPIVLTFRTGRDD